MGGGRMGEALVAGLLDAGWAAPSDVVVAEVSAARRQELGGLVSRHPGLQVVPAAVPARGTIIAVKPADVEGACAALAGSGIRRVLSVAAGVGLGHLEMWCPEDCAVIRAMPNTGALVRSGAAAIAAGSRVTAADLDWAAGIMRSVGTVVEVPEHLLDAVTGLSGCGPAYFFLVVEAMVEAGVAMGLPRSTAHDLVVQTMAGSARLLAESGQGPEALRAAVTSPGGSTAAGLRVLEAGRVRSAVIEAIAAATKRSREFDDKSAAAVEHGPTGRTE